MQKNSVIKGTLILTFASIITKILGFIYRIYMSNVIGAEGMGLYQLITPLYMLVWSISSSGFSTTISKLVAEENEKKEFGNVKRILKQSTITSVTIAIILSISLFYLSDYIALQIFKDKRTILSLHIIVFSFPFMAYSSCIRGYFLGMQLASIPAAAQILEQIIKMIVIYTLSSMFIPLGLSYACAVAVIGMCAGEFFSFLYIFISYNKYIEKHLQKKPPSLSIVKSYSKILKISVPLTSNKMLSSLLATIENVLIPQKLNAFGHSKTEAISLYGKLSGMSMPLIMFPSSLLMGLAISIMPEISKASASKNTNLIKNTISKTFLFTAIIGIGTAGIFITFANEIGLTIYNQSEIGSQLMLMGFISPLLYLQVSLSGILNGLSEQFFIFINNLISSLISIFFVYFLVPKYGINAFIFGWFISLLFSNIISLKQVRLKTSFKFDFNNFIFKPTIAILSSCIIVKYFYTNIFINLGKFISLILAILCVGIIYLFLLILLNCITILDIKNINFFKK